MLVGLCVSWENVAQANRTVLAAIFARPPPHKSPSEFDHPPGMHSFPHAPLSPFAYPLGTPNVGHLAWLAVMCLVLGWPARAIDPAAARGDEVETGRFERLEAQLASDDPLLRRAAVSALSGQSDPRVIGALTACLNDPDERVRFSAAQALQKLADSLAIDALAATLNDPDRRVREIAAAGLRKIHRNHATSDAATPILGKENALRWLDDRPPGAESPPPAAVELWGGDRLPGNVVAYEPGGWTERGWVPPHLLVEAVGGGLQRGGKSSSGLIRVRTDWLRRVYWRRDAAGGDQPASVVTRGGRQISFRSFRWQANSVQLLTLDGPRNYRFSDLAELHLPPIDPWQAWLEQLAWLTPTCSSRLIYVSHADGLRLTCSEDRFRAFADSINAAPGEWKHEVHPAWSLDPLLTNHLELRLTTCLPPHEFPLTHCEPSAAEHHSPLAGAPRWRADCNVVGGPLLSGGDVAAWGLGMHADCQVQFDLPAFARAVRTRVGLDTSVGRGGCARAVVRMAGSSPTVLFESPLLIGSDQVFDTSVLQFPPTQGDRSRLVLAADSAHAARPPGADPLNIRDRVNWLEPTLILDPEGLRAEVARAAAAQHPAWRDWDVEVDGDGPAPFAIPVGDSHSPHEPVALDVASGGRSITLTARRPLGETDRWLYLSARQVTRVDPPGRFEVLWNRLPIAELDVPSSRDDQPRLVSLAGCSADRSTAARLQVVYRPGDRLERIAWRALETMTRQTRAAWTPLRVVHSRVVGASRLTVEPDGGLLASGPQNYAETFVIDALAQLPKLTALRLEALADPRLPQGGPGRNNNGNFHLAHFQVSRPAVSRQPLVGRYVRVALSGDDRQLRLAEVQVFAPPPGDDELRDRVSAGADSAPRPAGYERQTEPVLEILDTPRQRRTWQQTVQLNSIRDRLCRNLALDGRASQSSTAEEGAADRAVDDDPFTEGSATSAQANPWWELDLGREVAIDRVVVWNPPYYYFVDQLRRFEVTVFDANRRQVFHRKDLPDPLPALEISQSDERVIPLAAAGAAAHQGWGDYRPERSLEFTTRGWSTGRPGRSEAITYLLADPLPLDENGLRITLRQCRGGVWQTAGTLGRFRLYATADPPPILVEPVGEEVPLLADRAGSTSE